MKKKLSKDNKKSYIVFFLIIAVVLIIILLLIYIDIKKDVDYKIDNYDNTNEKINNSGSETGKDVIELNDDIKSNSNQASSEEIEIGTNKYMEFLWMVDGAFNNKRYNNTIKVNGKNIKSNSFTCEYKTNNKDCYGNNFESAFKSLFAQNIKMEKVYGDGVSFKWYNIINDEYIFTNLNICDAERMSVDHEIYFVSKSKNELHFKTLFTDTIKEGTYKGENKFEKEFILVYQNNDWKIKKAYYHDPCYMEYIVE